jgi:hypothetical protein
MIYDHDGNVLGTTQVEVSLKLGISRTSVAKRLIPDGNDWVLRPKLQGDSVTGRKPMQRTIVSEAGELLGNSVVEVAQKLKINTSNLYGRMRQEGGVWVVRNAMRRGNPSWYRKQARRLADAQEITA